MRRKRISRIIAALCIALVCALLFRGDRKARTARYIQHNRQELEQLAAHLAESGEDMETEYNGWSVCYRANTGIVEFETGAFGIVPSSAYWGFYYSPENAPLPVMGAAEMGYTFFGDGWRWEEPEGDNWAYTERLAEGWFWYEMHF